MVFNIHTNNSVTKVSWLQEEDSEAEMSRSAKVYDADSVAEMLENHGHRHVVKVLREAAEYNMPILVADERRERGAVLLAEQELAEIEARAVAAREVLADRQARLAAATSARVDLEDGMAELDCVPGKIVTLFARTPSDQAPAPLLFSKRWVFGRASPKAKAKLV